MSISLDTLKEPVPAVFSREHVMSDRYHQVCTADVISPLLKEGFEIMTATQDNPTRRKAQHVTHSVTLRAPVKDQTRGEGVPQVIITNSHNGRTKFRMRGGLLRLVCSNGLIAGVDFVEPIAERHYDSRVGDLVERATKLGSLMESLADVVGDWKEIKLSRAKQQNFAKAAAKLRFGDRAESYEAEALLKPRREADEGDDLWRVFNVVQENTTRGGVSGVSANGRRVVTRDLTAILPSIEFNSQLWNLAAAVAKRAA